MAANCFQKLICTVQNNTIIYNAGVSFA